MQASNRLRDLVLRARRVVLVAAAGSPSGEAGRGDRPGDVAESRRASLRPPPRPGDSAERPASCLRLRPFVVSAAASFPPRGVAAPRGLGGESGGHPYPPRGSVDLRRADGDGDGTPHGSAVIELT